MKNTPDALCAARAMIEAGLSKKEIARQLGIHRTTLYRMLTGKTSPNRKRRSKLDPFKEYIRSRLRRFRLPATVMIDEICAQGYTGGLTILKEYMREVKQGYIQELVERFETEPGRQAQIDWGECGTIEHDGRERKLYLFVLVLGYSRYMWAEFTTTTRRPELIRLMERAFRDIGGVPEELVVDNMRQVIDKPARQGGPALVNHDFQEFGRWWGFRTIACPPYWPQAKGKVERGIGYIKRSFLEGRSFACLDDLNGQLRSWLACKANVRCHGTVKERPVDRLQRELTHMGSVQPDSYPSLQRCTRLVSNDARISYGGVLYSVDPEVARRRGTRVDVQVSVDGILRAYYGERLVAQHRVMPSGSAPQVDPLHAARLRELARESRPEAGPPRGRAPRYIQYEEPAVAEHQLEHYEEVSACAGV